MKSFLWMMPGLLAGLLSAPPREVMHIHQPVHEIGGRAQPLLPAQVSPQVSPRLLTVTATAYNCTPGQTDSTPHITASGLPCGGNVIAVSRDLLRVLPFGTRVRVAGREWVVGDTMNSRWRNRIDLPFPSRDGALRFGVRQMRMEVLK